ncbi:hypothetical protein DFH08DRAFT_943058 [Mycena albidolilacea]|uniref:Uncharacterized protein n=1 Tax=Mycena albidolilacea TaxID=1033008 RepID=A0AAD7EDM5_9AGAR|nr:hypothetical protein DFH08DRAFT_943058 [Mycena albidolilacea]
MADSDTSSSAPPVATLSPEMVALIAATVTAALRPQIQPPAAAPPAPPIEPPFTGSNATTEFGGKSLPALFPSIESKIILDILSHTFMPLDLPRLLSPLAARQDYVAPPSSAPATEHSLALKHFPSFHSLLRPLLKYFEVLAAFAASSEKHARLWDMKAGNYSGWARPDHGLLSRLVYSHPLPPPSASAPPRLPHMRGRPPELRLPEEDLGLRQSEPSSLRPCCSARSLGPAVSSCGREGERERVFGDKREIDWSPELSRSDRKGPRSSRHRRKQIQQNRESGKGGRKKKETVYRAM